MSHFQAAGDHGFFAAAAADAGSLLFCVSYVNYLKHVQDFTPEKETPRKNGAQSKGMQKQTANVQSADETSLPVVKSTSQPTTTMSMDQPV